MLFRSWCWRWIMRGAVGPRRRVRYAPSHPLGRPLLLWPFADDTVWLAFGIRAVTKQHMTGRTAFCKFCGGPDSRMLCGGPDSRTFCGSPDKATTTTVVRAGPGSDDDNNSINRDNIGYTTANHTIPSLVAAPARVLLSVDLMALPPFQQRPTLQFVAVRPHSSVVDGWCRHTAQCASHCSAR